jgi:hypothetical protein
MGNFSFIRRLHLIAYGTIIFAIGGISAAIGGIRRVA